MSTARRFCPASIALLAAVCVGTAGCTKQDTTPIQIGFVAGLTGKAADLGIGGRNGAQLAIDAFNAAGGLNGRPINLILKDDESSGERGKLVVGELVASKVTAIVGPMTSAVAAATAPIANDAGILMMGGTVTTTALTGIDDQFFRVIGSTTAHSATMANYLYESRKVRRAHLLVNLANKAYADSWATDFDTALKAREGGSTVRIDYTSSATTSFDELAARLMKGSPDAIILVTHTLDATHIANRLAKRQSKAVHVTSEWAGTGKLNELGGASVEGFVVPQYLDLNSTQPAYLAFHADYLKRFQQPPGFPAVVAYNATQVLLRALREQQTGESLKQTVLRLKTFEGLQESIRFDAFGDVQSPTYLTEVRDGNYVPLK